MSFSLLLFVIGCNSCMQASQSDKELSPPIVESAAGDDSLESPEPERPTFIDISLGETFACGVRTDGTLQCWGESEHAPAGNNWRRVEQSGDLTCALDSDGRVCCWGISEFSGDCTDRGVRYPEGPYTDIAVGQYFACGIGLQGEVTCWGGVAGLGIIMTSAADTPVRDITCGGVRLSALHVDDSYSYWRINSTVTPPVERHIAGEHIDVDFEELRLVDYMGGVWVQPGGHVLECVPADPPYPFYTHEVENVGSSVVAVHGDENAFCARYEDGHIACDSERMYDTGYYHEQYSADPPADQRFIDFDLYQDTNSGSKGCGVLEDGHLACWAHVLPNTKMFRDLP